MSVIFIDICFHHNYLPIFRLHISILVEIIMVYITEAVLNVISHYFVN